MLKNVYENKTLLFKGPYSIVFRDGGFETLGAVADKDEKIFIPENKRLPVMITKTGKIDVPDNYPSGVLEVNGSPIPVSWEKLVDKIIKNNINSVLVIGATDTGKSTLVHYLTNKLAQQNKSVGVIDSDLGQSTIGAAGTLGLSIIENKTYNLSEAKLYKSHFVGAFSPSLHCIETLIGLKKLSAAAMMNSNVVIIDTSGLIDGDNGRTLKLAKIELLNPDLVVLVQKNNECEHIVKSLNNQRIFRVGVSHYLREKTVEERKINRKNALAKYLANSHNLKLSLKKVKLRGCYYTTGEKIEIPESLNSVAQHIEKFGVREGILVVLKKKIENEKLSDLKKQFGVVKTFIAGQENNILVGLLNENNDYMGIGIIEKIDFIRENIYLFSNVDAAVIKSVVIGSMRCDIEGNECGYIEQGIL